MGLTSRSQARARKKVAREIGRKLGPHQVIVDRRAVAELLQAQRMFVAIVKSQGRVRLTEAELESLNEGDRITSKKDGDAVILSYAPIAQPELPPTPEGEPG